MKVSVLYTIVRDIEVDVDDKFKPLSDLDCPALLEDLLETVYNSDEMPDDCDIISIFDEEADCAIYES